MTDVSDKFIVTKEQLKNFIRGVREDGLDFAEDSFCFKLCACAAFYFFRQGMLDNQNDAQILFPGSEAYFLLLKNNKEGIHNLKYLNVGGNDPYIVRAGSEKEFLSSVTIKLYHDLETTVSENYDMYHKKSRNPKYNEVG